MTATRDPDRLLRAWLDLMPDEVPDRVIAAVLQATEGTLQVRRPLGPASWRFPTMNRRSFAATAVLIAAVAGGIVVLSGATQQLNPSLEPTPTPSSDASAAPGAALPPELRGWWLGPDLALAGLEPGAGTLLALDRAGARIAQSNHVATDLWFGTASIADGELRIDSPAFEGQGGCAGDPGIGHYAYQLSSTGQTLALTLDSARTACVTSGNSLLQGTWWKEDCKTFGPPCLGEMDAGTYKSQSIRPVLDGKSWAPKFGGLTFTVPDGWANDADSPSSFSLSRAADFEQSPGGHGAPRVILRSQIEAALVATCGTSYQPPADFSVNDIIYFLDAIPGLDVWNGHGAGWVIDGHKVKWITFSVDDATHRLCPESAQDVGSLLFGDVSPAAGRSGAIRVFFVDLGPGDLLAMSVEAPDEGTGDIVRPDVLPIIQSLHFD